MKYAAVVSLLGLAGMVANHYATHEKVRVRQAQGATEYAHPDGQTTHILNYLAGKEPMSREERLELIRSPGEEYCKMMNIDPPNFDRMDERQFMAWMLRTIPSGDGTDTLEGALKDLNSLIPLQRPYNPELYTTLWKIEMDVGTPYVRWSTARENKERGLGTITDDISCYSAFSNTVHIQPVSEPLRTLVAELAHARQFNEHPFSRYFRGAGSIGRTLARAVFEGRSLGDAYHQEYSTPGSIEYEAHQVIEPQLRRRIGRVGVLAD